MLLFNVEPILAIIFAMFGIPILMIITGFGFLFKNKKTAKKLFIIGTIYLIISLGICGSAIGYF